MRTTNAPYPTASPDSPRPVENKTGILRLLEQKTKFWLDKINISIVYSAANNLGRPRLYLRACEDDGGY